MTNIVRFIVKNKHQIYSRHGSRWYFNNVHKYRCHYRFNSTYNWEDLHDHLYRTKKSWLWPSYDFCISILIMKLKMVLCAICDCQPNEASFHSIESNLSSWMCPEQGCMKHVAFSVRIFNAETKLGYCTGLGIVSLDWQFTWITQTSTLSFKLGVHLSML